MTISSNEGAAPIVLTDVLVGEVWICSGQSNMQMAVDAVPEVIELIPKATDIRSFEVKRTAAFSFANFLQEAAGSPVGIILTAWGSSSLEAWMRESRMKALGLPHTGVANTIDLGELQNIHPKDKHPVVQRLAPFAARDTLEKKREAQRPVVKKVDAQGATLTINFDHADGLKTTDGIAPSGFWIADKSATWSPADATFKGQTVILRSSQSKPRSTFITPLQAFQK